MTDNMDIKLLRALQAEPTLSVAELGERIGLSHTPCWRRLKRLQDEGVIKGRNVLLDAEAMGLHITVFCFVRLDHHDKSSMEAFESSARAHPNILQCYTVSGEQDYVLRVVTSSIKAYEKLLKNDLLSLPSIGQVNSSIAMSEIKNTSLLPI